MAALWDAIPVARALLVALAALAFLASAVPGGAASALPGNNFPVTERTLYLTGEPGPADSLLLSELAPEGQGQTNFLAPGVDVLGLVVTPNQEAWTTRVSWDKDLEVVNDTVAVLYFRANVQGLTVFEVRLYDVAPDGTANLLDLNQQQFVTALSPTAVHFPLHTSGIQVLKGHHLRMEAYAQTTNAVVLLVYGGTTPSAIESLATRWLDSDGDGLADSDEILVGRNPLNANDPVEKLDEGRDTDGDGLSDRTERTIGTDPRLVDSDGDGFGDGLEVHAGSDPRDAASKPYDANRNGLPDTFETSYFNTTNISTSQTPCAPGAGCVDPRGDPDGDGCDNLCEASNGTDPTDYDTDDDGVGDGDELEDQTDPTSSLSVIGGSGARGIPEPVASAAFFAVGATLVILTLLRRPVP